MTPNKKNLLVNFFLHSQEGFSVVRSRKVVLIKVWWFHGFCSVWQFHNATVVSVLVALRLPKPSSRSACCGLLQMPFPSEIDELIVGLLPVCLCPVRRRPGYGWESQLWHLPWGYYCSRPAGGPGGLNPGSSSDPHTAVTPLETQRHSPLHGPLIGSDKMTVCGVQQFHRETTWSCQTSLQGSS